MIFPTPGAPAIDLGVTFHNLMRFKNFAIWQPSRRSARSRTGAPCSIGNALPFNS
jgi:hypothetical protein